MEVKDITIKIHIDVSEATASLDDLSDRIKSLISKEVMLKRLREDRQDLDEDH